MTSSKAKDIDEYISGFPSEIQEILENVRKAVKRAAPESEETIKYNMPTFTLDGKNLVYFSAYKKHIGFYPVPSGNTELEKEFSEYNTSGKGTIQFPYDKPMPLDLIAKIVKYRVEKVS